MHRPSSTVFQNAVSGDTSRQQQDFDVIADLDANIGVSLPEARSETTGTPQSAVEEYSASHHTTNKALDSATKAFVINWIQDHYERENDQSVARNDVYEHYATFCEGINLRPINSALFGKLMRSVFPDMKTRRLGTRGASKYHYGGIRKKEGERSGNHLVQSLAEVSPMNTTVSAISFMSQESPLPTNQSSLNFGSDIPSPNPHSLSIETLVAPLPLLTTSVTGTSESPLKLPRFFAPTLYNDHTDIAYESTVQLATDFTRLYAKHCSSLLTLAQTDQWTKIRKDLMDFWYGMDSKYTRFLRECNEIVEAIWRWDSALYDCIMVNAISDVTSSIPPQNTRALRQFAAQFENWVTESVKNFSADLNQIKVDVARIFVSKLRHRILLNHEAKLAAQIIRDEDKIDDLRRDWAAIDLAMVVDQTTWVCECRADDIENIVVKDIVSLLYEGKRLDDWIDWLKKITSKLMLKTMDAGRFVHHARQIILKWNHYSSAIQKDFSLRNAASLGTFMILRMFVDDYLVSLVESHIAELNVRLARPTAPPLEDEDQEHSGGEGADDHSQMPDSKSSREQSSKSPFHIVFHKFR